MDIIEILGLSVVILFFLYSYLSSKYQWQGGCGIFVYIFIGLCAIVLFCQKFGSRDPNSLFVRQNLIISTEVKFRPESESDYRNALLICKGAWFADSNEVTPLELIYSDEDKKEQVIELDQNGMIRFDGTRTVWDWDNNQYYVKLNKFITNHFHEKYAPSKSKMKDIERVRDWYEDRYKD
jgi:hypothetical protein